MQATVHRFDPATGSGAVVTDEGVVLPFSAEVFSGSRLRHLRVGQRLTVELDQPPDGTVPSVTAMRLGNVGVVPSISSHP